MTTRSRKRCDTLQWLRRSMPRSRRGIKTCNQQNYVLTHTRLRRRQLIFNFNLSHSSTSSSSSSYSPTTPKHPHAHSSAKHEKSRIARRWHREDTQSDYRPPIFQTPSCLSSPDISTPADTNSSLTQTSSSGAVHVRSVTTSASVEPIHSASSGMAQPQLAPSPRILPYHLSTSS